MIIFHMKDRFNHEWQDGGKKKALYRWRKVVAKGKVIMANGKEIELFRLKVLADAIDRLPRTIKEWEKHGLFRKPSVTFGDKETRYYTGVQILNIHLVWTRKYGAPTHLRDREQFLAMLKDFRTCLDGRYYDQYIVNINTGEIEPGTDSTNRLEVEGMTEPKK